MILPPFMLDTNIVSDILRNPQGTSARRAKTEGMSRICLSTVVACELYYGIRKKGATALTARVEEFLASVLILPFEPDCSEDFADIRVSLERAGTPIGPYDILIAAHARALGTTLVTDNIREFSRIDGLKLENWLERDPAND